ncbi:MAG: TVP38/TMEM64 family protein [Kurthia sp.]|nr:TVP38/TMEM64 family protein [Candidatus Kurthia equi]
MNKHKLIFRIIGYITFVICLFFLLKSSGLSVSDINPDTIRNLAHNNIPLILCMMLVIMILQNLFTFIPLVLVIATNITLFGFWNGYLFSCFSSVLGSTLIFLSIRYFFKGAFSHLKHSKHNEKLEKKGFIFVLSGRILPFMPTNLINILSAISSIKFTHFIVATTLGNMVYGFVLSSAAISVIVASSHNILYLVAIIAVAIIIFLIIHFRKKIKIKHKETDEAFH